MKKVPVFALLATAVVAYSQEDEHMRFVEGLREEHHIYIPARGDSLIYEIQSQIGEMYFFKLYLKEYITEESNENNCAVLDWISTSKRGGKGTIFITCNGLTGGEQLVNYFFPGITLLKNTMTTVFLSNKMFYEKRQQDISIDGKRYTLFDHFAFPVETVKIVSDEKNYYIEAYRLADNTSMNPEDPQSQATVEIWVQANEESPLIVYMKLPDFTLRLIQIK